MVEVASPARARSPIGLGPQSVRPGLADPALLSFSYQQFQIFSKIISFHFFQIRSFFSRLTIIRYRYFVENTFQYSLGKRRLHVCVLRAGRAGLGPRIQARCDLYIVVIGYVHSKYELRIMYCKYL